ncbi:hypothetical protein LXL04_018809 [Taraxacum kok-saghyz]
MDNVSDATVNETLDCISAGELRLYKDLLQINLPTCCKISFPNGKDDIMDFRVTIAPTNSLPTCKFCLPIELGLRKTIQYGFRQLSFVNPLSCHPFL